MPAFVISKVNAQALEFRDGRWFAISYLLTACRLCRRDR